MYVLVVQYFLILNLPVVHSTIEVWKLENQGLLVQYQNFISDRGEVVPSTDIYYHLEN